MLHNSDLQIRRAKPQLGTIVDIALFSKGDGNCDLVDLTNHAFAVVAEIQSLMSFFEESSDIGRLNAAEPFEVCTVSEETYEVLQLALQIQDRSKGAFDILSRSRQAYPDAQIELKGKREVYKTAPALIDLGGIAKGYAVDKAVDFLKAFDVSGIVNAGGDMRFFGGDDFPLAIRSPYSDGRFDHVGTFSDCAVATSVLMLDDGHQRSVSVKAKTCVIADALTKAIGLNCVEDAASLLLKFDASLVVPLKSERVV